MEICATAARGNRHQSSAAVKRQREREREFSVNVSDV